MAKTRKSRVQTPAAVATAVVYCRVSALDSQSESDISLEQQERTLTAMAEAAGYSEVLVISERTTGSKTQPELERALRLLADGHAAALFVSKVDRISRKGAGDVLRIAGQADREGWRLVLLDISLDTGTPTGRLVLTVMAGIAEFESRRRSERMAEYHAGRRARGQKSGVHYGPRNQTDPALAAEMLEAWVGGETLLAIAGRMTERTGRRWHPTQVSRVVRAAAQQPLQAAA